jgi:hypothetical protein
MEKPGTDRRPKRATMKAHPGRDKSGPYMAFMQPSKQTT